MNVRRKSCWLVLSLALLLIIPGDAFAQRRGGSSRSSFRSKPAARRAAPKATRKAAPKRAGKTGKASNKGAWGSSKKKAGKSKKATAADKKVYEKAKAQGTTFKTRKAASADFKKKNASKYTAKYTSRPTTRPGHIPQTTMVNGASTTIIYNQGGGGYGYMNSLGTFMLYNALADAAMAPYYNRQMASAGYYYGAPPRVGMSTGGTFLIVGSVLILVIIGGFMILGRSR